MQLMSIGKLARAANISIDTVRFYEKIGLLPCAARRTSGYRQYDCKDLCRLIVIRRARAAGFSLKEIGQLLALQTPSQIRDAKTQSLVQRKLASIEQKIAELEKFRIALSGIARTDSGDSPARANPLLEAFRAASK